MTSQVEEQVRVQIAEKFGFLFQPARYKGAFGGRGSAKSHSFAGALVVQAAQRPLRIMCCREIQRSIKDSVKRLLDDKIGEYNLGGFYDSIETEIRGANGSMFMFAGLRHNPDAIKSAEGLDIVWIEEAQTVSQKSLNMLVPTVRKPGSEIWASWNPDQPTDPIDKLLRADELPPGAVVKQVNYYDNPWFPDELRAEMEYDRRRDPEKYAHVWMGEYNKLSESRVFRNYVIEEFTTPRDVSVFYYGADWGFSIDPTVLTRCFIKGDKLYVDQEAWQIGCDIDDTPALFDTIPGSREWMITADSARPETISFMRKAGFRIKGAKKGQGSLEEGVNFLKSYDIVVHPRCRHVADEMATYSYKIDPHTEEVLPILKDKKNHTIDALRYAVEGVRRGGRKKPWEDVESLPEGKQVNKARIA